MPNKHSRGASRIPVRTYAKTLSPVIADNKFDVSSLLGSHYLEKKSQRPKSNLIPLRKNPKHEVYKLPKSISDMPVCDVKFNKPVVVVDPSDISFVSEPISREDLAAALIGLIPPQTAPLTQVDSNYVHPKEDCRNDSCVLQWRRKEMLDESERPRVAKSRNPTTISSKIPILKNIPNPITIVESMSRQSLLEDIRAPSDIVDSDNFSTISNEEILLLPKLNQRDQPVPNDQKMDVDDVDSDSNFSYFLESDTETTVKSADPVSVFELDLSAPAPTLADSSSTKDVPFCDVERPPRENGDGYYLLYKKKEFIHAMTKAEEKPIKTVTKEGEAIREAYEEKIKVILPKESTLILRRMDDPFAELPISSDSNSSLCFKFASRRFIATFAIHNPTADYHGFKIYCNSVGLAYLTVSPKIGLIGPRDRVTIYIKTQKCGEIAVTNERLSEAKLAIKTFRTFSDDPNDLEVYFEELSIKLPHLIKTDIVEKVVLLDSGDLISTTRLLDSFCKRTLSNKPFHESRASQAEETDFEEDYDEEIYENEEDESDVLMNMLMSKSSREAFKAKLYDEYAKEVLPNVRSLSSIQSMVMDVMSVNKKLRNYLYRFMKLEDFFNVFKCFFIIFLGFVWILPFLNTNVVVNEKTENEVYEELSFFGKAFFTGKKLASAIKFW